jgi:hypothetical protein
VETLDETKGDGGTGLMTEPTLDELKAEVDAINAEAQKYIWGLRADIDNIRYCRWEGQSADGLKHAASDAEEDEPEPFEGASDMRVRLADMLISEDVALLSLAGMRAQVNFYGTESQDKRLAGNMAILLRWVLRNLLGVQWVKELIKLANYYCGDSPAVALMGVVWRRETALRMERLTAADLMRLYLDEVAAALEEGDAEADPVALQAQAEQAAADFVAALESPELGEDVLGQKLQEYFPGLRPARARRVVRDMRRTGAAEFPVPYVRKDGPAVSAKRLYEDWFIPLNTLEFQDARIYFEVEWLSKTQIVERQISEGWDPKFVEEVIGKPGPDGKREGGYEGEAGFKEWVRIGAHGELQERTAEYYTGLYQILTAYYQAVNEDGVPGRYYVTFHYGAQTTATGRRLVDYAHGKYPGHVFQREILSGRLCDSRGLAELGGTYQGLLKVYVDSFGDHAQIAGVPPVITRNRQRQGVLHIKPLQELPAKRDGDYAWMSPPAYPRTVVDMVKELRRQVDEYFGRRNQETAEDLVELRREFKVLWFLINLREVLVQVWQLCQQYMSDETIQRVTNGKGEQLFRSREEIQGQYDLELRFDPRDLDPEHIKNIGGVVKDLLLAMDRDKTIQTAPIVSSLLWRLAPELAEEAVVDVGAAREAETAAEIKAYQEIRAGTEPELPDDGSINYALRLELYRNMEGMNPDIYRDMAEDKLAILQSRLQRLEALAQQYGENVQIGREGGRRALPAG